MPAFEKDLVLSCCRLITETSADITHIRPPKLPLQALISLSTGWRRQDDPKCGVRRIIRDHRFSSDYIMTPGELRVTSVIGLCAFSHQSLEISELIKMQGSLVFPVGSRRIHRKDV